MKNFPIWYNNITNTNNSEKRSFSNIKTDILIIGGGITGITTAYFLKNNSKKVTIIDKDKIGSGVTLASTAKITYLQGIIYQTLSKNFNNDVAKQYFNSQKEAISIIKNIVNYNNIECDLTKVDSIVFTTEEKAVEKIDKEKQILKKWNVNIENVINKNIKSGIKITDSYVFNPSKYLFKLKKIIEKNVDIYEYVIAKNIRYNNGIYIVDTNNGVIQASKVIIACHYSFFLLPSFIPLKTYIKKEYINAGKIDNPQNFCAINIDNDLHSIRYYNDYIIYGSNKQKLTSKTYYKKAYEKSKENFERYFKIKPKYTWMNQDIVSNNYLPYIGSIRKNLYLATAYNAWGITNGTIAGKIVFDLIINNDSIYKNLFLPTRKNLLLTTNLY